MNAKTLTRVAAPWLHSALGDAGTIVDELRAFEAEGKLTARVIRGMKAETEPRFFDEIAARHAIPARFRRELGRGARLLNRYPLVVRPRPWCCASWMDRGSSGWQQRSNAGIAAMFSRKRLVGLNRDGRSFHVIWQTTAQAAADLRSLWPDLAPVGLRTVQVPIVPHFTSPSPARSRRWDRRLASR